MAITTESVHLGDIEQTVLANGTLKPVKLVAVGAQLSGRLISLDVKVGQNIRKGDLIAQIDPVTKQNDLKISQAALENMRAQRDEKSATLQLAESALDRQKTTLALKASSRADYESAVATVNQTKAQISSFDAQISEAEISVDTAKVNLEYTKIEAPIDGTVLAVFAQEGQTVNAAQSAPTIAILGQLDLMTIRAEISEVDVVRVKPGQEVYFTILGDVDRRYTATLDAIEPAPESIKNDSSVTSSSSSSSSSSSTSTSAIYYNAVFTAPNPDGQLRTYMTAEVHVVVASAKNVVLISSSALGQRGDDGSYTVEVVDATNSVSTRKVKIGIDNKIQAQIVSGLAKDDKIITRKYDSSVAKADGFPSGPGSGQ